MVWVDSGGAERRSCEMRLAGTGDGYGLVIRDEKKTRVEPFGDLRELLSREHQLLSAWKAQGWKNAEAAQPTVRGTHGAGSRAILETA